MSDNKILASQSTPKNKNHETNPALLQTKTLAETEPKGTQAPPKKKITKRTQGRCKQTTYLANLETGLN
jgi:hypothetical protein